MTWKLVYTKAALKQLRKIDPHQRALILSWMSKNVDGCSEPRIHGKELAANRAGQWRFRVADYRILCELHDHELVVYAFSVGPRRDIYN